MDDDKIIRSFTTPKTLLDEVRAIAAKLAVSVNVAHIEGLKLWVKKNKRAGE